MRPLTTLAKPEPCLVRIAAGDMIIDADGWASSISIGIYRTPDSFASLLFVPGVVLAEGFETLMEAHRFNQMVLTHRKIYAGSPDIEEFYRSAGGRAEAQREIEKLKTRARLAMTKPKTQSKPKKDVKK